MVNLILCGNNDQLMYFLGLPYDIAMYGLLLQLLAEGFEYAKGELIGCFGDCHLYNNHIDQAKQQLG